MRIGINAFPVTVNGTTAIFAGLLGSLLRGDSTNHYIIFSRLENLRTIHQVLADHHEAGNEPGARIRVIQIADEGQIYAYRYDFDLYFCPLNNVNPRIYDRPTVAIVPDDESSGGETIAELCDCSTVLVTMSEPGKARLIEKFAVDPGKIEVLAGGEVDVSEEVRQTDVSGARLLDIFRHARDRFAWGRHKPGSVNRPNIGVAIRLPRGGSHIGQTIQSLLETGYPSLVIRCLTAVDLPDEIVKFLRTAGAEIVRCDTSTPAGNDLLAFAREKNLDVVGEMFEGNRAKKRAFDSIAAAFLDAPDKAVYIGEAFDWRGESFSGIARLRRTGNLIWKIDGQLYPEMLFFNPVTLAASPKLIACVNNGEFAWRSALVREARQSGLLCMTHRTLADCDRDSLPLDSAEIHSATHRWQDRWKGQAQAKSGSQDLALVVAVVPAFNRCDKTVEFLRQFSAVDYANKRVVICDDGSTDNTHANILLNYSDVTVIRGNGDLWWSGGTNAAIHQALEMGADYILTINDDVHMEPNFLTEMVRVARQNPKYIVGGRLHCQDRPDYVWSIGATCTFKGHDIYTPNGWGKQWDEIKTLYHDPQPVDTMCGNGVLVPRGVFEDVGFYDDENMPQYHADSDLVLRAAARGWIPVISLSSVLYNHINTVPLVNDRWNVIFNRKSDRYWRAIWTTVKRYGPFGKRIWLLSLQYTPFFIPPWIQRIYQRPQAK